MSTGSDAGWVDQVSWTQAPHPQLHEVLTASTPENFAWFGFSVSGVADVDGDGFGDYVVGAPYEDPLVDPDGAGRAYIFSGLNGAFGYSVSGIPDVNGNVSGDVIVGAPFEGTVVESGRAYIFDGSTGEVLERLLPHIHSATAHSGCE